MINKIIITLILLYCSTSSANDLSSMFDVKIGSNINSVEDLIRTDEYDRAYKTINFEDFETAVIFYTPKTKKISKIASLRKAKSDCNTDSKSLMTVFSKDYGDFTENNFFNQKSYSVENLTKKIKITCNKELLLFELMDNDLEQDRNREKHQIIFLKDALHKLRIEKNFLIKNNNYETRLATDEKMKFLRKYRDDVYHKLYSNWVRPSDSKRGWECKIHVEQTDKGNVIDVKFIDCQNDIEFKKSIKDSVFKSSPLPLPEHPYLFNTTVEIKFKVT